MRTKPELWKSIVKKYKESSKGGDKGEWSARKAQLAVKEYKSKGGGYTSKKSESNSLSKWTKGDWDYVLGDKKGRYLPKAVRSKLSKKEKLKTNKNKKEGDKKGKQKVSYKGKVKKLMKTYSKK